MIMTLQRASGPIRSVVQYMVGLAVLALVSVVSVSTDASLQAAESGIRSATAFGAKGDGTYDDTAAIQNALDEASTAGGQVFLPPGRYLVGGSLRVPPGVTLQGGMDSPVWSE